MSTSPTHKTFVAGAILVLAFALAGCGERQAQINQPEAAPRDLSGSLPTAEQGAGQQPAGDQPPSQPPTGTDRQSQGAPPEEATDFAPVDVTLKDGGFAKGTPKTIHIPSNFIVIVTARAADRQAYKLSVTSPSAAQTFTVKPRGEQKITLDAMRDGQSAKLIIGAQTIKIAADAEPGP